MEHKVGAPGMPAAVAVFNLLLYSPAHDGEHIKCSPARAELAMNLTFRATRADASLLKRGLSWGVFGVSLVESGSCLEDSDF